MTTNNVFLDPRDTKKPIRHRRFGESSAHRIDPNPGLSSFQRGSLCQPYHSMLARTIGRSPGGTDQACNRRHVDDGSGTALAKHLPNLVLETKPDTLEIDGDRLIPIVLGLSNNGRQDTLDARVIEGNVQTPKFLYRVLYKLLDFSGFRNVRFYE